MWSSAGKPCRGSFGPLDAAELGASETEALEASEIEALDANTSDSINRSATGIRCFRTSKAWNRTVGIVAVLGIAGLWFGWSRLSVMMDQTTSSQKESDPVEDGIVLLDQRPGGIGNFFDSVKGLLRGAGLNPANSATTTMRAPQDLTTTRASPVPITTVAPLQPAGSARVQATTTAPPVQPAFRPLHTTLVARLPQVLATTTAPPVQAATVALQVLTTTAAPPVPITTVALQVLTQPPSAERECHTTVPGEDCYDKVYLAATEGVYQHPEWYVGLGPESPVELFQGILATRGKCPLPCDTYTLLTRTTTETSTTTTTATSRPWHFPALFCFSVAMASTYEMDIMMRQHAEGVGIFECEESAVLCEHEIDIGGGVTTIVFPHAEVGKSKDGTAGNTQVFMNAWHAVHKDGRYLKTHFTVKVDPDAVIVPDRLRSRVEDHIMEGPVFFLNCNRYPDNPDYPMMYGAMEVYSTEAVTAYIQGEARCKKELPIWPLLGEDSFMTKCLERLQVKAVLDNDMVSDDRCRAPTEDKTFDCKDPTAAGFHEFKDVDGWFHCLAQTKSAIPTSQFV